MLDEVYLSIGTNLGNRAENIFTAHEKISSKMGLIVNYSAIYETSPWGFDHENNFYNQVVSVNTYFSPQKLLERIKSIEQGMGRKQQKSKHYEARVMDIDILFYQDKIIHDSGLIIPHPRLKNRMFVLRPLCDVAPELVHPVYQVTMRMLLNECPDESEVKPAAI